MSKRKWFHWLVVVVLLAVPLALFWYINSKN
jgi:hypothetical protein